MSIYDALVDVGEYMLCVRVVYSAVSALFHIL